MHIMVTQGGLMSLSIVHTRAALGVNAPPITVEVHISKGLPGLTMVGLPETTVKEARDRVRSAIINSGYEYPAKKITINLAPADLPKEGGRYDLPIAIALLAASEQLTANKLDEYELVGELALTGALRGVPGCVLRRHEPPRAPGPVQPDEPGDRLGVRARLRAAARAARQRRQGRYAPHVALCGRRGGRAQPDPGRPPAPTDHGGENKREHADRDRMRQVDRRRPD